MMGRPGTTTQNLTEPYKKHAMKTCNHCQIERPLIEFRRYSHRKVREMPTCNLCVPPKTLSDMTPREREEALKTSHRNASPSLVARLNERDKARKRETLSYKLTAVNIRRRKENWKVAIIKQAKEEHLWAYATLLRYRKQVQENPAAAKQRAPYIEFFDEYARILKHMITDMEFRCKAHNAPLHPTEEDKNPLSYIDPIQRSGLREIYSECTPIPGTRPARAPWFLSWREPDEPTGNKSSPHGGDTDE